MEQFHRDFNGYRLVGTGDESCLDLPMVCVTGARRATPYGIALAHMCGKAVAKAGLTLLTTAAIGCAAEAARAALENGGGVVVFAATGLDFIYPSQSSDIFDAASCVVSLERPGTSPMPRNFRRRNMVIGRLADVMVVCESGMPSGVLDMAQHSDEVWAFPGSVFSRTSDGTNELIKAGARMICGEMDLHDALRDRFALASDAFCRADGPTDSYEAVVNALKASPMHASELSKSLGIDFTHLLHVLGALEMDDSVERLPDGRYTPSARRLYV